MWLVSVTYTCVLTWEDLCTSDDRFDAILLKWRSLFVLHIYGLVFRSRCLTYWWRTYHCYAIVLSLFSHCNAHIEKRVVISMLSITHVLRSGVRGYDKMVCVDSCDHQSRVVYIFSISQRTSFHDMPGVATLYVNTWLLQPGCRWGLRCPPKGRYRYRQ